MVRREKPVCERERCEELATVNARIEMVLHSLALNILKRNAFVCMFLALLKRTMGTQTNQHHTNTFFRNSNSEMKPKKRIN